jgi:hypothetical protein
MAAKVKDLRRRYFFRLAPVNPAKIAPPSRVCRKRLRVIAAKGYQLRFKFSEEIRFVKLIWKQNNDKTDSVGSFIQVLRPSQELEL